MKKLFFIIVLSISLFTFQMVFAQTYPCVRNISTNPNNPYNEEWTSIYPTDPGSFVNTWFSWYPNSLTLKIPISRQNWAVPASFNGTYLAMIWPFSSSNDDDKGNNAYLLNPFISADKRDYHWEDGWELLWMNMGYLPNGSEIQDMPANSWYGNTSPFPSYLPYFVLYNRYRGTMRIFANIFTFSDEYPYRYVNARVQFIEGDVIYNTLSGILRSAMGVDMALDQPSEIYKVNFPKMFWMNDESKWYVIETQLAFDPCQCKTPSRMRFSFEGVTGIEIQHEARGVTIDPLVTKFRVDQKNLIQSVQGHQGNMIYKSLDKFMIDYVKNLENYQNLLNDYNADQNALKQETIELLKLASKGTAINLNNSSAKLVDFINTNQLPVWADSLANPSKQNTQKIIASSKKMMADQYDFLNILLDVKENQPIRPHVPFATLSDGQFKGEITTITEKSSGSLFVPGTKPTAYNSSTGDIRPTNFPAYNNLPGLFALLETPKIQIYDKKLEATKNADWWSLIRGGINKLDPTDYPQTSKEISLRLKDGLHYALNPALDWDTERTKVLFAFQLELDMGTYKMSDLDKIQTALDSVGGNFELTHRLTDANGKTTAILTSKYYNIEDAKKAIFSLNLLNSLDLNANAIFNSYDLSLLLDKLYFKENPKISRIKMKIAGDFWFQQIGYDGDQVNTFQVFTYDLYNSKEHTSLKSAMDDAGGTLETNENWILFKPGKIQLDTLISPGNQLVSAQVGNTLYIRGEDIEITGTVGAVSGYNLEIEALKSVQIKPGGSLLPNAKAAIKDIYGEGNNPIADAAYITNFCATAYKANQLSNEALLRAKENDQTGLAETEKLTISIFPNPATNYIQYEIKNQPTDATKIKLTLRDITGRQILQRQENLNPSGEYQLNLPDLSSGVYLLQITIWEKSGLEKVVIK